MPTFFCQTMRSPSRGQGVRMPFSGETLLPVGPRKPGQSLPARGSLAATAATCPEGGGPQPQASTQINQTWKRMGICPPADEPFHRPHAQYRKCAVWPARPQPGLETWAYDRIITEVLRMTKRTWSEAWRSDGGGSELLHLAWPLILSNSFWTLQIATDRILLSRSSSDAVAAAMVAAVLFWTPLTLLQNTANYATTFV